MLPSAGGALPLVITFNTGLVVLAVLQLILALSLSSRDLYFLGIA